jgi:hypothetical protein
MVSPDEPVRKNSEPQARKRNRTMGFSTENTERKKQPEFIFGKSNENIPGEKSFVDCFFFLSVLRILPLTPHRRRQTGFIRDSFLQDGAGFGDVGVEGFDEGGILLFDDAALELEGKGEATVVKSKIFGEKSEALDGFVLREVNREALDLGVD